MYLVILNSYPSAEKKYAKAFVHRRVINYIEAGLNIYIYVLDEKRNSFSYEYEGVKVQVGGKNELVKIINESNCKKILIHFISAKMIEPLEKSIKKPEIIIWFHGVEALLWYRRWFNFNFWNPKEVLKFILLGFYNIYSMNLVKKFIKENRNRITGIAVSEWMKTMVEKDAKFSLDQWYIIPNVIDENVFFYSQKSPADRYKLISVRPFTSKKYANDITIKLIQELSLYKEFSKLEILLIGDGPLHKKLISKVNKFSNVIVIKKFLSHGELAETYKNFGFFLCPTRQDSQGVSMCEAMACGLIPVTNKSSAIPEFVPTNGGIIVDNYNYKQMAEKIIEMIKNENRFFNTSQIASKYIKNKCSTINTTQKEIEIIKGEVKK